MYKMIDRRLIVHAIILLSLLVLNFLIIKP